ncbi:MAG TPA: hypothetical protein VJ732_16085 [Bryobacteraceae bacterium]|nr:hypothetical protein [Bryobacteraceae bacterium]
MAAAAAAIVGGGYQIPRALQTTRISSAEAPADEREGRPVYPYSVIPGGVRSGAELEAALRADSTAAEHYADFDGAHARLAAWGEEQAVYVSYRLPQGIYWTREPVRLKRGEEVLSDGVHLARARCGNRISKTPQRPEYAYEPAPTAFEIPEVPPTMEFPWPLPDYTDPKWVPEEVPPMPGFPIPGRKPSRPYAETPEPGGVLLLVTVVGGLLAIRTWGKRLRRGG